MKATLIAGATTLMTLMTVSSGARADTQVPPNGVYLRNIVYAGSGCPAGSLTDSLRDDYAAIDLIFDSLVAEVGPGVPFSAKRKNCTINIDLAVPAGWSYTLSGVTLAGYATLDPGVTATAGLSYYFQGGAATGRIQSTFTGPYDDDIFVTDHLGTSAQVWSPCGKQRSLNVNVQVIATASRSGASGQIELAGYDVPGGFELSWKRCW